MKKTKDTLFCQEQSLRVDVSPVQESGMSHKLKQIRVQRCDSNHYQDSKSDPLTSHKANEITDVTSVIMYDPSDWYVIIKWLIVFKLLMSFLISQWNQHYQFAIIWLFNW